MLFFFAGCSVGFSSKIQLRLGLAVSLWEDFSVGFFVEATLSD